MKFKAIVTTCLETPHVYEIEDASGAILERDADDESGRKILTFCAANDRYWLRSFYKDSILSITLIPQP